MKIHQILGAPSIILTNEEQNFIKQHNKEIAIRNLYDRDEVLARNLVRKGVYEISNDNENLILKKDTSDRKSPVWKIWKDGQGRQARFQKQRAGHSN